jgi:hypothetical protein
MFKTKWHYLLTVLGLYGFGTIFLITTSPDNLPVALLIAPFIYIFICLYLTTLLIVGFLGSWIRHSRIAAGIVAIVGTLLLLLSSLHQLTARDVILSMSVTLIVMWYLQKSSR